MDVVVTIQWRWLGYRTNNEARQLGASTPPVPTRKFIIHELINMLTDIHLLLYAVIYTCVTIGILMLILANHNLMKVVWCQRRGLESQV